MFKEEQRLIIKLIMNSALQEKNVVFKSCLDLDCPFKILLKSSVPFSQ